MKLTNREMFNAILMIGTTHETGKLGYMLCKNDRKLKTEAKEYIDERNKWIEENAGKTQTKLSPKQVEALEEHLASIADDAFEIDIFRVTEDVFTSGNMDTAQMEALWYMCQELWDEHEKEGSKKKEEDK